MAQTWDGSYDIGGQSDDSYHLDRHRVEPIYDAFICPLTKQVMRDPVALENGRTFEREAIEKWFKECRESGRKPSCPLTLNELKSTELNSSVGLRNTIEEWNARNEAVQFRMACRSLSLGSSDTESDILQALKFVRNLCQKNGSNKHVLNREMTPMIIHTLRNSSVRVRCKALETLKVVVEEDSEIKEMMAEGDTVHRLVKSLFHEQSKEREEAVSLLYELSKSEKLCEKIGSINGSILLLVGMASSKSENLVTVEKADKILDNLAKSVSNVRQMAQNGRLQPLLTLLLEGSPETKLSMAALLGELVLNKDVKVYVAQTAGSSLINLMKTNDMQSRESSLKALSQISSDEESAVCLIEAGILPPLVNDLFAVGVNQLPTRLKEVSAMILSNVVNTGYDFHSVPVGPDNQTLVSEEIIHNLLHLIGNTGPAIECKLFQVLVGLTSSPATVSSVVSAIKSSGAAISLVQFVEAPQKDLRVASLKLLHTLSAHMGEELVCCLRSIPGQLGGLIGVISENTGITEEQAEAVGFLANLSERDTSLTREMIDQRAIQLFISRVIRIRQGETRSNRFMTPYLEGLVKVLARITFVLSEETGNVHSICSEHNLASLFIELLQANGLDKVQMVSAMALENLSRESKNLTKLPENPAPGFCGCVFLCLSKPRVITGLCRVHQGTCSLKESFCLLKGHAIDKLVALLDHTNENVVEASFGALSTLLDDGVNIEQGVQVLLETESIKPIIHILLEKRTENLRKRAIWAVERLLRNREIAFEVSGDPNISTALVDAFQNGDYRTRQIAEHALRHIDKIPTFSGVFAKKG